MHKEDRRRKRSQDPLIALHYQLAHARTTGALDTIVVADSSGVVVAGAGSWAACEELAAYAPLLAGAHTNVDRGESNESPSRVDVLLRETAIATFQIDDQELLVCARGGAARKGALEAAAFGVARILKAAA